VKFIDKPDLAFFGGKLQENVTTAVYNWMEWHQWSRHAVGQAVVYRVDRKKSAHLCTPYNTFQTSLLSESGKISKDSSKPQMCRYTTLWNVNVLKQQLKTRRLL